MHVFVLANSGDKMKNIPHSIKSALQLIMLNFSFSANARTSHLLMNQRDQYCIFVLLRFIDSDTPPEDRFFSNKLIKENRAL
jgi:hypothetical protein